MDSSQGTQYIYQLPEEGQVSESHNNGELYATGEGEGDGTYEQVMMGEEGQSGLAVDSSADEIEQTGQGGEEALFTYAHASGEMPISSSDITTSYAIADENGENGMTQVYFLTEDGVLTTAMPDMGEGTLMLQPVEGSDGEGQLQVVYQQIDEGITPESSTSPQYVTMPVEGIGTGAEYMDMTIAEGAVGSTSTMMEGMTEEQMQQESGGETEEHGVALLHSVQAQSSIRQQPISVKTVSQHQVGRGGAHVTLVGVPSKKPATTIITVQKPQSGIAGASGIVRTAISTPKPTVSLATPSGIGTPSAVTPSGGSRCNVCRKVNCTTKHRVKFPGETKLNKGVSGTYIVMSDSPSASGVVSESASPLVRGVGPGRPRGRGRGRGMTTAMGFAPLDTSGGSGDESTPVRGTPLRGRGGRGGIIVPHVAEGNIKSETENKQLPGLQGHWLKAMHGTSLMEVDDSSIEQELDQEDTRAKPLVEVKRMEAAKTVIFEIKRPSAGEQPKSTVVEVIRGGSDGEKSVAFNSEGEDQPSTSDGGKGKRPIVMVTKLPDDKEKLAAKIASLMAEGKKKRDGSDYEEEDLEWVPSSAKKKARSEEEEVEGSDESGRKSHRERKLTSKFAEFVTQVTPAKAHANAASHTSAATHASVTSHAAAHIATSVHVAATTHVATATPIKTLGLPHLGTPATAVLRKDSGTSTQHVKEESEESPSQKAKAAGKRKGPVTVTPSQVVLSYGKMQEGGPRQIIVQPPAAKDVINKAVLCKPYAQTKATMCRPYMLNKEIQTEEGMFAKPVVIPVPVPIYLPTPMAMYTTPTPYPVPLPIPVPVPCFIPLTKRAADVILKHIKELSETEPADPFEAELLHMAEMVAKAHEEAPPEETDVKIPMDVSNVANQASGELAPEDVLQIALRMASEIPEETVVDFEEALDNLAVGGMDENAMAMPDAQSFLKYSFGVNAWKLWVLQKNIQIEQLAAKHAGKVSKQLFKTELLQCTPEELNYSLCLFVKEVRKPNGDEYAPDSIYYLCLGIQQYLYENGRLDNIFTDVYYEKFTDCLNEVLQRYEIRLNTQGMVVARIEEEHLWETRQLGAHSPFVLLNTLIYFNTKYFLLKSAEEHLSLAFTDIMKHWKKTNSLGGKAPGKMFFLRYFAPLPPDGSGRKRRDESVIFEQPENLDNPLRCPVKLYEFYLSKCPESVRNRNDLFYLVPEKSCVPDSPVWYSTQPLGIDMMIKMLSRLRIVRELQEIYLHQAYEVTIQI